MLGALTTEKKKTSPLRGREQLLPGTQQRLLYNTIKYCSLSPLCPLVFLPIRFPAHSSIFLSL